MDDIVRTGQSVLLDINDGERYLFARLNSSATVKLGKAKYSLASVIGSPFGSLFELQRGPTGNGFLGRCSIDSAGEDLDDGADDEGPDVSNKDNRNLIDNNTAQNLSAEDIDELRRDGSSGRDIVNALIANSASFDSKTAFSQEKYRRKKQRKYAPRIKIRRPTARSVCEAYFSKSPQKIGGLRIDSLSTLLAFANVGSNSNVLVLDTVGGMLTAAVAERMNGCGSLCSVYYTAKPPSSEIVNLFNFSFETSSRIFRTPLSKLLEIHSSSRKQDSLVLEKPPVPEESIRQMETDSGVMELETENRNAAEAELSGADVEQTTVLDEAIEKTEAGPVSGMDMEVEKPEAIPGRRNRGDKSEKTNINRLGQQASDDDISACLQEGFSSLVIAAPDCEPLEVLQKLLPFLAPSSPFAVYHPYLQPLSECMFSLQKARFCLSLQLSEPWMREYQVLPSRTHPHMQMSASGGYLLSGIRVVEQQSVL